MACHRAGYEMDVQPPKFVAKIGRDAANAWMRIAAWPSDQNRRPGERSVGAR
jgi:hypothetical protein